MDDLKEKGSQDRSKINMHEEHEVKCWIHQLGEQRAASEGRRQDGQRSRRCS
jgi:hypothetical protein